MAFELPSLFDSTNADLIFTGLGFYALKVFGVVDLVKGKLNGSANGKSLREHMTSEADAKENSRTMIQDIHRNSAESYRILESSSTASAVQTELLRSMDSNIRELLQVSRK